MFSLVDTFFIMNMQTIREDDPDCLLRLSSHQRLCIQKDGEYRKLPPPGSPLLAEGRKRDSITNSLGRNETLNRRAGKILTFAWFDLTRWGAPHTPLGLSLLFTYSVPFFCSTSLRREGCFEVY